MNKQYKTTKKRVSIIFFVLLYSTVTSGQVDMVTPFQKCNIKGSTTIYDYRNKKWLLSDSVDVNVETLPASTFKVINLLIALETGVIKDENETVKWVGHQDTTLYGYRPEIYRDLTVRQAFEVSAVWVFIELAKKIGKEKYMQFLKECRYGNGNLSEKGADFWNFGSFGVTPRNQIEFLIRVYENKLPFAKRNIDILKKVMITEKTDKYTLRSKTGWTRVNGNDTGWWIGYVERKDNVYFFATRLIKKRSIVNPDFGQCRKDITKDILKQLHAIE